MEVIFFTLTGEEGVDYPINDTRFCLTSFYRTRLCLASTGDTVLSEGSTSVIGVRKAPGGPRQRPVLDALPSVRPLPRRGQADRLATRATLRHAAAEARRVTDADRAAGTLLLGTAAHRTLLVERDGGKPALPGLAIRALVRTLRLRGAFSSPDVRREGPSLAAVARTGARAVAAVPFRLREVEGCLAVVSDFPHRFDEADIERLQGVAHSASLWAAIAEEVVTSERCRIARQLHDVFGQTLTSLVFAIDQVETARSGVKKQALTRAARSCAMQAVRDLRAAIDSVLEPDAQPAEALGTITELVRDFSQSGIKVRLASGCPLASLPPEVSTCLYQVVREALLNVRRHSGANEARVIVWRRARCVEVIISDNGVGLRRRGDPKTNRGGFGLRLMRERVEEIGGSLVLQSVPGQGTRVIARIP